MTEGEWLTCTDLQAMLQFLHDKVSERKLRLFAVACCRRVWPLLRHRDSQRAVEMSEQYADGRSTTKALLLAERKAKAVAAELDVEATVLMRLPAWAARDAAQAAAE